MIPVRFLWFLVLSICAASCTRHKETASEALDASSDNQQQPISQEEQEVRARWHFLVGQFAEMSGDIGTAGAHYQEGYILDPNSYLAGKSLRIAVATRPKEEVLVEARKMALLYPESASMRFLYGQILAMRQNLPGAEKEIRRAIQLDPKFEDARFFLIGLLVTNNRLNEAVKESKELVGTFPGNPQAWKTLATLHIKMKNYGSGLEASEKAYFLRDKDSEIAVIYAYLLELNKRTKEAVQVFGEILAFSPGSEELASQIVKIYRELGGLEKALKILDRMLKETSPPSPALQVQKAFILWEMEQFENAFNFLEEANKLSPESNLLAYMKGLAAEKIGKVREAVLSYRQVDDGSQYKPHAVFRPSLVFYGQKQYENALLEAAPLQKNPYSEESILYLANIYKKIDQIHKSIEVIEDGLEKYPDVADIYFAYGVYLEQIGQVEKTILAMRKTIELDPSHASAHNYIGYIFAERGENLNEAEALLLKALELKPGEGAYLDSLGWVYFQQGRYGEAEIKLLEAAKKIADDFVVWEHLGYLYEKTNRIEDSKESFQKALELAKEQKDRQRLEKKVNEISTQLDEGNI